MKVKLFFLILINLFINLKIFGSCPDRAEYVCTHFVDSKDGTVLQKGFSADGTQIQWYRTKDFKPLPKDRIAKKIKDTIYVPCISEHALSLAKCEIDSYELLKALHRCYNELHGTDDPSAQEEAFTVISTCS